MDKWSYTILNIIFFVPVIAFLFFRYKAIIIKRFRFIIASGIFGIILFFVIDLPATNWGAWQYDYSKVLGINFGKSVFEELVWAVLVCMIIALIIEIFLERSMARITIIIGLPGSGKSMYLKDNQEKFNDVFICDDYHKSSYKKSRCFEDSLFYNDLQKALKEGKNVVLTDIAYCKADKLKNAEEGIKRMAKELNLEIEIEHLYFENDPEACKQNIMRRNRTERIERELAYIDETSKQYVIPKNAKVLSVFRD